MSFIKLNQKEIHYSHRNHNSSQNLLLIHGAGGTEALWPRGFKKIESVNYYAVDLPGHGKSKGKNCQTIEEYAGFIEKFVQHLNLSSIVLLGHSMGGAIVLELALRKPAWLSKLILLNTGAFLNVNPKLLEKIETNFEEAIQQIVKWSYSPVVSAALLKEAKEQLLKLNSKILYDDFKACDQLDLRDRVQEIKTPTLIIAGEKDQMTPLQYSEFLHQKIQNSILQVVSEGSHTMVLEEPKVIIDLVTTFVNNP